MKDTNGLYNARYRINSARRMGYDYSQAGGYFITICTKNREHSFGEIHPATDALTDAYLIGNELAVRTWNCWQEIPQHFPFVEPDAFVVMPDHVHGILFINRTADYAERPETRFGPQSDNLASIIRGFKAWATRQGINFNWQPRYYDRIIRNELELEKIRDYIQGNPNRWEAEQQNELSLFR
ncbi:transposase [Hymenobacter sp. DH14]|uniref:Transposase n=1 Tax=Hymenobacter cyanobacteriorum TaxID=2926463 RepID=A0A9X1VI17_9BACT|nr:transposase [Hymenobacter cyanobacteriorum]MCI1189544.1 transposase [Hymenobacter cyanobacteriorum]